MFFDMSLSFNQNSKQYVHVRAAWHESSVKGKLISFNFLCNKIPSRFKLHAQTLFQVSKLINGKSKWNLNIMLMRKFVKTIFVRFVRKGNLLERPTFRPDYHSIWIHKYVSINICVYTRSRISRERASSCHHKQATGVSILITHLAKILWNFNVYIKFVCWKQTCE